MAGTSPLVSSIRGRIRERDLYIPALRAAASRPNGWISTSDLIEMIEEFEPEGEDAETIDGRNDSKFSQIVRNLISHKENLTSMFTKDHAEYVDGGIRVTDQGRGFLAQAPE